MQKTALVTGGAGFIGSHLASLLLKKKYKVIVYDDLSNGSGEKNLSKNIKFVKGSILNSNKFRSVCKKANVVFHLAVKPLTMSFDRPEEVVRVNDFGTYLIAKVCTELRCKLIHISSSEAYGSAKSIPMKENHPFFPSTIYASSKAASELYVRGFEKTDGLKMVIIRPFNSYGPFMRDDVYAAAIPKFYSRLKNRKPLIIHGNGNQTRDLTYVEDTVYGIMLADKASGAIGDIFNIGQGKETSVKNMAKTMLKKYSEITNTPLIDRLIYQKVRKGDVKRHLADISHARKILGYKPRINLQDGIERYIEWKFSDQ